MNKFDLMNDALAEARAANEAEDRHANQMAGMLRGRLRQVSTYTLRELKRELQSFDASRKAWKENK